MSKIDIQTNKKITAETLIALRSGNHNAYEMIYLQYANPIKDFLITLTRSEEIAKEITQEVFITLWEKRILINPENNISGYLYTIARNIALKYFEHQKVIEKFVLSSPDNQDIVRPADDMLLLREKEIMIKVAIDRMPPQRKKIYKLSREKGFSNDKIANILSISKNTVENHITSALKDIRRVIAFLIIPMSIILSL